MAGALDYAELLIIAVAENDGALIPPGSWTLPDGCTLEGGAVLTYDTIPAQGVLMASNDG